MRYCAILYHNNCTMADFVHFLPKTVSYEFFYIGNLNHYFNRHVCPSICACVRASVTKIFFCLNHLGITP